MINILIVEDDPMVAELNKRFVDSIKGFNIVGVAHDGEEALKFLKNKKVDLMLLDVYMPKLDGITLLKKIRNQFLMVDVILVTAAKEADNINEGLKLGAVDYLIKPFEYERFKSSLENYKARFKLLNNHGIVEQEDIDRITKINIENRPASLQKGLHEKTLERIRHIMRNKEDGLVTSGDIAEKIQVSKVTIRRYLEYLVSIGEVKLEIEYGAIGRPNHLYRYIGKK